MVCLTDKVVRGLALMKAACGASPCETLLGMDEATTKEEKKEMENYEAAVRWIEYQQGQRALKKARTAQ